MKKNLKFLPCITTLAIMVIIFLFSSQSADDSTQTSTGFIQFVIDIVNTIFNTKHDVSLAEDIDFFVRKAAHFGIYALLGLNACWMFARLIDNITKANTVLLSTLFCFVYACSDELHQLFSFGRSCSFSDVLLDSAGAFFGSVCFLILLIITRILHKRR